MHMSKTLLDFGFASSLSPVRKTISETIVITNNSNKKISFCLHFMERQTHQISISPQQGVLQKGKQVEVKLDLTILCTSKIRDIILCQFNHSHLNQILSINLESELSLTLDYEELSRFPFPFLVFLFLF